MVDEADNHHNLREPNHLDLYSWLSQLLQTGAKMATASQLVIRVALLASLLALLAGISILFWIRDYHWIWGLLFTIVASIPIIILGYYHWILTSLREAPEQLKSLKAVIDRFSAEHPQETREVLSRPISSLGKWKTYQLIGKVLKDIFDGASIAGNIKALSAMANPIFWVSLMAAIVLSFAFTGCIAIALIILAIV